MRLLAVTGSSGPGQPRFHRSSPAKVRRRRPSVRSPILERRVRVASRESWRSLESGPMGDITAYQPAALTSSSVAARHSRNVPSLSLSANAKTLSPAAKVSVERLPIVGSPRVSFSWPVKGSHNLTFLSAPAAASLFPSREKATDVTSPACSVSLLTSTSVLESKILTPPIREANASLVPSGDIAIQTIMSFRGTLRSSFTLSGESCRSHSLVCCCRSRCRRRDVCRQSRMPRH